MSASRRLGVMAGDRVVGEPAQQIEVVGRPGVLETPHPQMTARNPGQHRARQQRLPLDRRPGRDDRQRAGGGNAERKHRLADDVLPQHRTDNGQAVPAAGEGRPSAALQMQIAQVSGRVDEFTEQQRPAVTQPRRVVAELVPGVGLRDRGRITGDGRAEQQVQSVRAAQPVGVDAEFDGQRLVQHQQVRRRGRGGLRRQCHLAEFAGETTGQGDGRGRGNTHVIEPTSAAGRHRAVGEPLSRVSHGSSNCVDH